MQTTKFISGQPSNPPSSWPTRAPTADRHLPPPLTCHAGRWAPPAFAPCHTGPPLRLLHLAPHIEPLPTLPLPFPPLCSNREDATTPPPPPCLHHCLWSNPATGGRPPCPNHAEELPPPPMVRTTPPCSSYGISSCLTFVCPYGVVLRRPIIITHRTKGKFEPKWEGPFIIEQVYDSGAYQLVDHQGLRPILRLMGDTLRNILLDQVSMQFFLPFSLLCFFFSFHFSSCFFSFQKCFTKIWTHKSYIKGFSCTSHQVG
jgi:hypothetical protein